MPTPRHASHAAIDPVETVTPPFDAPEASRRKAVVGERSLGASRANWLVLHLSFYVKSDFEAGLEVIAWQDAPRIELKEDLKWLSK